MLRHLNRDFLACFVVSVASRSFLVAKFRPMMIEFSVFSDISSTALYFSLPAVQTSWTSSGIVVSFHPSEFLLEAWALVLGKS